MSRLAQYGGRMIQTDGIPTVEMVDPNDNARRLYQYRRTTGGIERRVLRADGSAFVDTGSPWEALSEQEVILLYAARGQYHPILDSLGLS